jgi:hypothetical protein
MPLPSLLEAIPVALAGAANWFRAAQVVSVVASSAVASWPGASGRDVAAEMKLPVGRARTLGVGAGLLAAVLGPLVVYGALPDSTALFTALSLAACLLMTRLAAAETARQAAAKTARHGSTPPVPRPLPQPTSAPPIDAPARPTAVSSLLGLLLGFAALTRSEAIWLALAWAAVAWFWTPGSRRRASPHRHPGRRRHCSSSSPWLVRDWLAFGTPLPGQTIGNALFIHYTDVFAYQDAALRSAATSVRGPRRWRAPTRRASPTTSSRSWRSRVPGRPDRTLVAAMGGRRRALRPLLLVSAITFVVTSLAFPRRHSVGNLPPRRRNRVRAAVVCCVAALDQLIVRSAGSVTGPDPWPGSVPLSRSRRRRRCASSQ